MISSVIKGPPIVLICAVPGIFLASDCSFKVSKQCEQQETAIVSFTIIWNGNGKRQLNIPMLILLVQLVFFLLSHGTNFLYQTQKTFMGMCVYLYLCTLTLPKVTQVKHKVTLAMETLSFTATYTHTHFQVGAGKTLLHISFRAQRKCQQFCLFKANVSTLFSNVSCHRLLCGTLK